MVCLYFHVNLISNEIFYVGIGDLKRPYETSGRNNFWKKVVNKYGYKINIIKQNLTWEEAYSLEKMYIKLIGRRTLKLGPLVNLTDGGQGSPGMIHSIESKNKISKSHIGIKQTEESKHKISVFNAGRKQSKETIDKKVLKLKGQKRSKEFIERLRIMNTGRVRSEESKRKQSESRKGRKNSPETKIKIGLKSLGKKLSESAKLKIANFNKKPVLQLDMNNNIIKEWDSALDAEIALGIHRFNIGACCRKTKKTAGKYMWKFKNESNEL